MDNDDTEHAAKRCRSNEEQSMEAVTTQCDEPDLIKAAAGDMHNESSLINNNNQTANKNNVDKTISNENSNLASINDDDSMEGAKKIDQTDDVAVDFSEAGEQPSTSSLIVKRKGRKHLRNYRKHETDDSSRSSSPSTSSSGLDKKVAEIKVALESVENNPEDLLTTETGTNGVPSVNNVPESAATADDDDDDISVDLRPRSSESDNSSFSIMFEDSDDNDDDDDDDDVSDLATFLTRNRADSDHESQESGVGASGTNKNPDKEAAEKILSLPKPPYWSTAYELMRREHGLNGDGRSSHRNGFTSAFNNRFYASRQVVESMKISHVLRKHNGCVNCLNFNRSGDLIVSGSDDRRLVVWDWAANKTKHVWKSGHSLNIFQAKFLQSSGCLDIISSGRDGTVRRSVIPPSGGKVQTTNVYSHRGSVHKLVICPDSPYKIISVGEDGFITSKDLREDHSKHDLLQVVSTTKKSKKVSLYSISHHPTAPEVCVSGNDSFVRVYDKRLWSKPVYTMCPEHILKPCTPHVTCCVYNSTGSEILATYSEEHIYLFNNKTYNEGEFLHCYKGHYNRKTIKGVNFFGPNSEYIISGSDCGHIFYWDKNTEAIINFMPGDTKGVVNCLEPHPSAPILATSGIDSDVKIWVPGAENTCPSEDKLKACLRRNMRRSLIDDTVEFDNSQVEFFLRQLLYNRHRSSRRNRGDGDNGDNNTDSDDSANSDSSSMVEFSRNGIDSDDMDDVPTNLHRMECGTQ